MGSNIRPRKATGWKIQNSRLKEVLLRDKPEVIPLQRKFLLSPPTPHLTLYLFRLNLFFLFWTLLLFYTLSYFPSYSFFSRITATIDHLFSFNALIYWLRFSPVCFFFFSSLFIYFLFLKFSDSDCRTDYRQRSL